MTAEGIRFITNANVGQEISAEELHKNNDAVSLRKNSDQVTSGQLLVYFRFGIRIRILNQTNYIKIMMRQV